LNVTYLDYKLSVHLAPTSLMDENMANKYINGCDKSRIIRWFKRRT